jgi:hypothetical protein
MRKRTKRKRRHKHMHDKHKHSWLLALPVHATLLELAEE